MRKAIRYFEESTSVSNVAFGKIDVEITVSDRNGNIAEISGDDEIRELLNKCKDAIDIIESMK
jgi:hypothetical protein